MVKSLVFGAPLLVSGILLGMWIRTPGDQGPENQPSSDPPNISEVVAAVDEPTAPGSHEEGFLGVVLPTEAVDVAAETDGRLESVEVRVGDRVQKDDRIATIDTRSLERDLQMAEAALRALEADRQQVRTALASAIDRLERRIGSPDLFPAGGIGGSTVPKGSRRRIGSGDRSADRGSRRACGSTPGSQRRRRRAGAFRWGRIHAAPGRGGDSQSGGLRLCGSSRMVRCPSDSLSPATGPAHLMWAIRCVSPSRGLTGQSWEPSQLSLQRWMWLPE